MSSKWPRRVIVVLLGVTMLLMIPAVSLGDTFRVRATSSNTWSPGFKPISRGDRIRWKNPTGRRHNIRAYGSNWSYRASLSANGGTATKTFRTRGHYAYRCSLHSTLRSGDCNGMCGSIHVGS